jgi:hypothetical protein
LWIDAVTWNHKYVIGQKSDETYHLSIKVTDSLNRVAYWDGDIEEFLEPLTGRLLPLYQMGESMRVAAAPISTDWPPPALGYDAVGTSAMPTAFAITSNGRINYGTTSQVAVSSVPTAFQIGSIVRHTYREEVRARVSNTPTAIFYKTHKSSMARIEPVSVSNTPTGISYGS